MAGMASAVPALVVVAVWRRPSADCGDDDNDEVRAPRAARRSTSVGKGEGQVNLVAWAGYVEDGSTDPKVDWVTPFEKQTGCKVNVKVGNTSDEMVTLMRTGQYDGVSASGDATAAADRRRRRGAGQHRPGARTTRTSTRR